MELTMPLRRVVALAAALAVAPIALAGCSAPAPVAEKTPTVEPTTAPELPVDKEAEEAPADAGFIDVFDDSSVVTVQVPDTWTQVDGAAVTTTEGVQLFSVLASPDIEGYNTSWGTPGVVVAATTDFSVAPEEYLVNVISSYGGDCGQPETDAYDDGVYVGTYVFLPACGGIDAEFLAIAATDIAQTHIIIVQLQMVTDEDKTVVFDQVVRTFFALF